ncbi:hypothetical protein [Streptomyces sp. NPDC057238]|uniref:hypothetical protein n=1 Tax=Streptomyces sp. NPDC057238 TaxID=3346060 RepID=UPI00363339FB
MTARPLAHTTHGGLASPDLAQPITDEPVTRPQPALMPPAPVLPSVLHDPAAGSSAPPPTSPETASAVVGEPTPLAAPTDVSVEVAAARYHTRVVQLHRTFLALHTEAHRRFLDTRGRVTARLLVGVPSTDSPLVAPPGSGPDRSTLAFAPQSPEERFHEGPHKPFPGPFLDRAALEKLATGPVSQVLGPLFQAQDHLCRQTRVPGPPMLLIDRVLGIDAEPGSMGMGALWTETDLRHDSWFLDQTGRIPATFMLEAGHGQLLLISWLGVDLTGSGDRVCRLLGTEATYHGSPPRLGQTLRYEVRAQGHAEHNGLRLFTCSIDCLVDGELRLTMRNAQVGFFTDEELRNAGGLQWDPPADPPADLPHDILEPPSSKRAFGPDAVRALAAGRPHACFGPEWDACRAHLRTPRLDDSRLLMIDEVTEFDPKGGVWGRGYLRAETAVRPDAWYFENHFPNDPCMPATLMLHGGHQAMSFYLMALGLTRHHDGARFEPVPDFPGVTRCRGQVTPDNRRLVFEVHVSGLDAGPAPRLYADVLVTVDGVPSHHTANASLRLVHDLPLTHWRELGPRVEQTDGSHIDLAGLAGLVGHTEPKPVATYEGHALGYASLLACAWGWPSEVYGPAFAHYDPMPGLVHLPGPPYFFVSRVAEYDAEAYTPRAGSKVVTEYDVPDQVWYYEQNTAPVMPYAVFLEAVLQPCGWLIAFTLGMKRRRVVLRNLGGTARVHREVRRGARTMRGTAELIGVSQHGVMTLVSFAIEVELDGAPLVSLTSQFGFFPEEAFDHQTGIPSSDEDLAWLHRPCNFSFDLTDDQDDGRPPLPGQMLRAVDRVTGYWPEAGPAGLGRLRGEKRVDPDHWIFKVHFFQDPVQPGSMGVEAMAQLLQFYLVHTATREELATSRLEPMMQNREFSWKYRGQVVPANDLVTVEIAITATGHDAQGRWATADGWLWVDGLRIYHMSGLGMRLVCDRPGEGRDAGSE